jgi:hypothetical protein
MDVLGAAVIVVGVLCFLAAQGAAVFCLACIVLRLVKMSNWIAKIAAMAASYIAWVIFTITAYTVLGGEWGLLDGFGFVLFLCTLAGVSSAVYLLGWMLWPRRAGLAKAP